MNWMEKFVALLQSWKFYSMNHPKPFLNNESFIALLHTVKTALIMIPERLHHQNHNVIVMLCIMLYKYHVHVIVYANKDDDDYYYKYILLSKFRIDNSEGWFGLYKQLSDCIYLLSIQCYAQ